jgi:glycerol-3-phosphate O-acyltransferase
MKQFYEHYIREGIRGGWPKQELIEIAEKYRLQILKETENPTPFSIYHLALPSQREFGLSFFRPLIDFERSQILGMDHLKEINEKIERKENVILLSNHQTEPDPQAISLLLEKPFPKLMEGMIFVAGDRVIRDPVAIPMSLGCNLLCIYSKKYIDTPPEKREEKLLHNKRTLGKMEELLREGGKLIYVAPSGGRDRKEEKGTLLPAPFVPESVELLYLIGKKSGSKTSFHTLALKTYDLLPPPPTINIALGEERRLTHTPIHLNFGAELQLDNIEGPRQEMRQERTRRAFEQLLSDYHKIDSLA